MVEMSSNNSGSLLLQAIKLENPKEAMRILKDMPDVPLEAVNSNTGGTALSLAAYNNSFVNVVGKLVDNGAVLDQQDTGGNTPLILACMSNQPKIAMLLLEKGANSSIKNYRGMSALDAIGPYVADEMGDVYNELERRKERRERVMSGLDENEEDKPNGNNGRNRANSRSTVASEARNNTSSPRGSFSYAPEPNVTRTKNSGNNVQSVLAKTRKRKSRRRSTRRHRRT